MCVVGVRVFMISYAQLFETPWTAACQAPCLWDLPGKNIGLGCNFLLQDTHPLCLLHCRWILTTWAIREAHIERQHFYFQNDSGFFTMPRQQSHEVIGFFVKINETVSLIMNTCTHHMLTDVDYCFIFGFVENHLVIDSNKQKRQNRH